MSKGQQAMVVAMMYPEPAKTKRKGSGFVVFKFDDFIGYPS
jgi:hypothetical protein